jgi:hypothetical protein
MPVIRTNITDPINIRFESQSAFAGASEASADLEFFVLALIKIVKGLVETFLYDLVFRSKKENETEGMV